MLNIFAATLGLLLVWPSVLPYAWSNAAQRPAFRTEVNYVELDVSVSNKDGSPVRGLTRDDFEVLENGKVQTVSTFTAMNLPVLGAPVSRTNRLLTESTLASNAGLADGRVYLIVLDTGTLSPGRSPKVRQQIGQFIDEFLAPNDLAAVAAIGLTPHATPFTNDKAQLLAALGAMGSFAGSADQLAADAGLASTSELTDAWSAEIYAAYTSMEQSWLVTQAAIGFDQLGSIAGFLKGLDGRRKSIVFVSEGVNIEPKASGADTRVSPTALSSAAARLIRELTGANVTVYSIDPLGLQAYNPVNNGPGGAQRGAIPQMQMLRQLSDETGGLAAVGINDLSQAFRKIVEDNSSYYVIGFDSNQKIDGETHAIAVRVRGRDVDVRYRSQIDTAKSSTNRKRNPIELASAWRGSDIKSLLTRPLPTDAFGLSLRASASLMKMQGRDGIVQLTVEVAPSGLVFDAADGKFRDTIAVAYQALGADGALTASRTDTVKMGLTPQGHAAVLAHGWRYTTEITLPPGLHELRVAASESGAAHAGSVFLPIAIPTLKNGALTILSAALTSKSARLMPTAGTASVAGTQEPAATTRTFSTSDTITVVAGLVDTIDGEHSVQLSASLMSATSRGASVTATPKSSELRPGAPPQKLSLPLGGAAPGSYVVLVEMSAAGKTASRRVPITIK